MTAELVLVSGWAHTADALAALANRLSPEIRTRCLSLNELAAESGSEAHALEDLIRSSAQPCFVGGWSMGGMIALAAAARAPERVQGVVLISSAARMAAAPGYPGVPERLLKETREAFERAPDQMLLRFFTRVAFPHLPQSLDEQCGKALSLGRDLLGRQLEELFGMDLRDVVSQLPMKLLILHGARDRIVPVSCALWLREHARAAELRIEPDAGHRLPLDNPEVVAKHIREFVQARV